MEEPDFERYNFRTKTPISSELIARIDAHYDGGLTKWKTRHFPLVIRQRKEIEFFHIAVSQLFESAQRGYPGAIDILDKVIACTSARRCHRHRIRPDRSRHRGCHHRNCQRIGHPAQYDVHERLDLT